ncbi:MAG: UDP-glucose/GDP-mannose dehydrogenase family protein [Lactobacillaceae bacterium]|jgi:UDPglucose 6-dehydrogenase|nr:UDP-glucose/GDP-mannose dehydrogenase family protein [Lactobacillaceae bacterium]
MKIGIIGTGYVGLPTGVGLAELGNDVTCIDKDLNKIDSLKNGKITIFEDGLEELYLKNIKNGKLKFTTSMKDGVENADLVMIAVGTPPHPVTKEADMKYIYAAAEELAEYITGYTVIANKSTVPIGTGDEVEKIIKDKNKKADFDVVSLPEFLREGFAIHDFFNPDRIVVGSNSGRASDVLRTLYKPFENKSNMLFVKRRSSETIKYASNAFLAMKIHYINEMANFCEKVDADVFEVAQGMGTDTRIGNKFLNPGPGYGGSCFPKDTNAMAYMARQNCINLSLIETTIKRNDERKAEMAERIINAVSDVAKSKIGVLGLAFKNGTDDCRESPAVQIIEHLIEKGAKNIKAFDPKALDNAKQILKNQISYAIDEYDAAKDADILVVLTEWKEFRDLDFNKVKKLMKTPKIMDLRNILNFEEIKNFGFEYHSIGRQHTPCKVK